MPSEPFPEPWSDGFSTYIPLSSPQLILRIQMLQKLDREIAKYLRNQRIIDDIKRRCGVTTEEKK